MLTITVVPTGIFVDDDADPVAVPASVAATVPASVAASVAAAVALAVLLTVTVVALAVAADATLCRSCCHGNFDGFAAVVVFLAEVLFLRAIVCSLLLL